LLGRGACGARRGGATSPGDMSPSRNIFSRP
jgi:hypothetical protein